MLDQLHQMSVCAEEKDSRSCECLYHQSFYGKFRSTVTCLACKNVTTAGDPFIDLSLDLHHQAKRRKLDVGLPSNEAPLELTGCLGSFTSSERLPPDAYTCKSEKCQNTPQRALKHVTIKKLPPSLCIQLKASILPTLHYPSPTLPLTLPQRFAHTKTNASKLETKLTYPLQLDMSPYTTAQHRKKKSLPSDPLSPSSPLSPRSPGWYDLTSVIVHIGKMDAGHYICYCRRDDEWFKFDDNKVTLATEAQVLRADAYLLFYLVRSLGPGVEDAQAASNGST